MDRSCPLPSFESAFGYGSTTLGSGNHSVQSTQQGTCSHVSVNYSDLANCVNRKTINSESSIFSIEKDDISTPQSSGESKYDAILEKSGHSQAVAVQNCEGSSTLFSREPFKPVEENSILGIDIPENGQEFEKYERIDINRRSRENYRKKNAYPWSKRAAK